MVHESNKEQPWPWVPPALSPVSLSCAPTRWVCTPFLGPWSLHTSELPPLLLNIAPPRFRTQSISLRAALAPLRTAPFTPSQLPPSAHSCSHTHICPSPAIPQFCLLAPLKPHTAAPHPRSAPHPPTAAHTHQNCPSHLPPPLTSAPHLPDQTLRTAHLSSHLTYLFRSAPHTPHICPPPPQICPISSHICPPPLPYLPTHLRSAPLPSHLPLKTAPFLSNPPPSPQNCPSPPRSDPQICPSPFTSHLSLQICPSSLRSAPLPSLPPLSLQNSSHLPLFSLPSYPPFSPYICSHTSDLPLGTAFSPYNCPSLSYLPFSP